MSTMRDQPQHKRATRGGRAAGAMVAMRDQGVSQREQEDMQLAQASQAVGGALMARLHKNFSHAAEVSMFMQVRDLPLALLRRIPIPETSAMAEKNGGNGVNISATAENLEDFCRRVFARSYSKMAEEQQNLMALGEESYEAASRLGLNRSALRAARALPPESLETVRLAISNGSSKAEVLSVIEDLAEKIETAEKQVAELQAENTASEELLSKRDATIKRLEREVKRFEKLPPDEKLLALQKDVADAMNDARGAVLGRMRQAVIALVNFGEDRHAHDVFLAGLVGQVQAELKMLRDEFNLADVGGKPEWERWADAQDLAKTGTRTKAKN